MVAVQHCKLSERCNFTHFSDQGLSSTYQELDKEHPRDEGSISNRTELAKILHIEKLLKRNKVSNDVICSFDTAV